MNAGYVPSLQDAAANKFIQERFVPKLVAAGIALAVDILRKPDVDAHPGLAIINKADEVDAALIIVTPHEHEFVEVSRLTRSLACCLLERCAERHACSAGDGGAAGESEVRLAGCCSLRRAGCPGQPGLCEVPMLAGAVS